METKISNLTLMFTDLVGSTELYNRVGDEAALKEVHAHFDRAVQVLQRHRGTLVKTMGDAIMAIFENPRDAVQAAFELHHGGGRLPVRIGLHSGACCTVETAEGLDYFGTTVNLAARAQSLCEGGQIVMTEAVARHPEVVTLLQARQRRAIRFETAIKGFGKRMRLFRLVGAICRGRKSLGSFELAVNAVLTVALLTLSACGPSRVMSDTGHALVIRADHNSLILHRYISHRKAMARP